MQTTTAVLWLFVLISSFPTSSIADADNATEANFINTSSSPEQGPPSHISSSLAQAFTITAITITVVGSIANGYVLLALVLTKNSRKNNINVFIMHQTTLDLTASIFQFIGMMVNAVGKSMSRTPVHFVCLIFETYTISVSASHASVCGLVIITMERYVKIVHPVAHRNKYRTWMTRAGIVIPWVFGILTDFIPTVATTGIVGGQCIRNNLWPKNELKIAYEVVKSLILYPVPLTALVFAYWKILRVIRRQRKQIGQNHQQVGTSATASNAATVAEKNSRRTEMNVIKTMLLVSVAFAFCYFPIRAYSVLLQFEAVPRIPSLYRLFAVFLYSSQCINPFIYASQYDVVRRWWKAKVCRVFCGQQEESATTQGQVLPESGQPHQSMKKL